ncbi:hypothetical protein C8R44DRAFT_731597 [Mycena epipterygia]|nr:hypothetical protein C8R44DRAFT_731597 [Mycena epipterygia]
MDEPSEDISSQVTTGDISRIPVMTIDGCKCWKGKENVPEVTSRHRKDRPLEFLDKNSVDHANSSRAIQCAWMLEFVVLSDAFLSGAANRSVAFKVHKYYQQVIHESQPAIGEEPAQADDLDNVQNMLGTEESMSSLTSGCSGNECKSQKPIGRRTRRRLSART